MVIERLKSSVREGVMLSAVHLSIFAAMLSYPVDLEVSSATRRSNTESSVQSKSIGHSFGINTNTMRACQCYNKIL